MVYVMFRYNVQDSRMHTCISINYLQRNYLAIDFVLSSFFSFLNKTFEDFYTLYIYKFCILCVNR